MAIPESFDRSRLSPREEEILLFAIEGMTDIQIALKLDISQSTVNSYWVRVRGKLGQLSRTELVALALKQKAEREISVLKAEGKELARQAQEHAQLTDDFRQAENYHAALDALPEAMLYLCDRGLIRYTNERLDVMFGYDKGELIGKPFQTLMPPRRRDKEGQAMESYLADPTPLRFGIDSVVYGARRDGREFRVILLLDSRRTSTGLITSCIVRDFLAEVDLRRRIATARAQADNSSDPLISRIGTYAA